MKTTRRLTAVTLVLLLLLSLCGCMAEEPTPAEQGDTTAVPTQVTTTDSNKRVLVLIKYDYIDESKEYKAEDFPGIEVTQVETKIYRHTMGHPDKSFTTQVVYVTLRNTGNSYFQEAVSSISRLPFVEKAEEDKGITFIG